MNPGIFLIQDNEQLIEMTEQTYESEKLLQTWLSQYPALLVGNQIDAKQPKRFLLIEQECGVPGGRPEPTDGLSIICSSIKMPFQQLLR